MLETYGTSAFHVRRDKAALSRSYGANMNLTETGMSTSALAPAQDEIATLFVGFELSKATWLIGLYSPQLGKTISPDFSYPVRDVKRLRGAARNTGKRCGAQFARVIADGVRARVGRKPGSSYVWLVVLGRQRTAAASRKWARANSF